MSIINVSKLSEKVAKNYYTYIRVKNMLAGLKGRSTKKEIQQVRKIVTEEFESILNTLDQLEQK